MFSAWCPVMQTRLLHSPAEIVRLDSGERGITIEYRCVCGEQHTMTSGRRARHDGGAARTCA